MLDMDQIIKTISISEAIKKGILVYAETQAGTRNPHSFAQRSDQVIQIIATKPISISDSQHPREIKW